MEDQTEGMGRESFGSMGNDMPKKGSKKKLVVLVIVLVVVAGALFLMKGKFIAASVNGSYISRASVIRELEKKSGKDLVDILITQRLIADEARKQKIVITDAEINAKIEEAKTQITAQGGKFEDFLSMQGLTEAVLRDNLKIQMQVEKLVGDKITVTDEEVATYIKDNKVKLEKGKEDATRTQIKEQLRGGKISKEASALIKTLHESAKIKYYGSYAK